jgi:putative ABC transport system permease protein
MVIAVLERRWEIGLRRALGATRGQIRSQFLTESLLLSCLGGAVGVVVGFAVTAGYASMRSWPMVLPVRPLVGAMGATVVIGTLSGLYPAIRASRLAPTVALATT